jgi:hypothetical protein
MERCDTLAGTCVGFDPAIEHEENPRYQEYLTSIGHPSVESEKERAKRGVRALQA